MTKANKQQQQPLNWELSFSSCITREVLWWPLKLHLNYPPGKVGTPIWWLWDGWIYNTQHWTQWGQGQFVMYTYSLGEQNIATTQSQGCIQEESEPAGVVVGGRLRSVKTVMCPWALLGGCDWLAWILLWAGKEQKFLLKSQKQIGRTPGPLDKEGGLTREHY